MRNICMVLMLFMGAGLTQGAQIVQNFMIPSSGTPASVNFMNSTDVARFDPLLGTLLSINFDLEGTINGTQFIDNEDNNGIVNGTGATTVQLNLSNASAGHLITVAPVASFTFTVTGDSDVNPDFQGTDFASNSFANVVKSANTTISDAMVLGIFSGPGNITLNLSALGSFEVTPGGNLATLTFTQGLARGTITYVYNEAPSTAEIPEPLTMLLIGGGLAMIGLRKRGRFERSQAA